MLVDFSVGNENLPAREKVSLIVLNDLLIILEAIESFGGAFLQVGVFNFIFTLFNERIKPWPYSTPFLWITLHVVIFHSLTIIISS